MADEQRQLSPYEQMKAENARRQQAVEDAKNQFAESQAIAARQAEEPSVIGEIGRATWGAGVDLVTETSIFLKDASQTILPVMQLGAGIESLVAGDGFDAGVRRYNTANAEYNQDLRRAADELAPENETFLGSAGRNLIQFVVPYAGLAKVAGGARTVKEATTLGALVDFSLFDPNEGNLSAILNEMAPEYRNVVTDFLATDPDDSEAVNRMRNALEGAGLGLAFEGIFKMARFVRGAKKVEEGRAIGAEHETSLDDARAAADETPVDEPQAREAGDQADPEADVPPAREEPVDEAARAQAEAEENARVFTKDADKFEFTGAQRSALNRALLEGDDEAVVSVLKDFNFDKIDWDKVGADGQGIARLMNTISDTFVDVIDDAKGGVQTHAHTQRLADLVGSTAENISALYGSVRGDRGITARMLAADRTLLASAKRLYQLRQVAADNPGDLAAKAKFMEHGQLHVALQAEVKGARTEIARALNGMKIIRADADEGFTEFNDVLRQMGGGNVKDFNKMMDELLDSDGGLKALNARLREKLKPRPRDMFIEYVINAMLSSPKTHLINFASNVLNTFLYTGDRYLAGIGRLAAGDKQAFREANIDLIGKFSQLDEAFALARQAWRDGAPVSDARQRIEYQTRKAINSGGRATDLQAGDEALKTEGTEFFGRRRTVVRDEEGNTLNAIERDFMQRAVVTLGNIVRTPGRLLITGDEFFKAVTRNAEIKVLAFRKADELAQAQGLEIGTKKYESFLRKTMVKLADPKNKTKQGIELRIDAIEKSRLATFQEAPTTGGGKKMEDLINHNPFVKLVIAPFFRTPMNLLRQGVIDRTPLGLVLKNNREIIRKGGREAQEMKARMLTGVAAMAAFYPLVGNEDGFFEIVGKVPYDSSRKAEGILDYSIRFGDKYYQFNRLDPMGMWLGMMADMKTHMEYNEDDSVAFAFTQGALSGFMNNVTDKTWAKSLSDLYEMSTGISGNRPETAGRAIQQFAGSEVGKLIPQLFKSVGKVAFDGDERMSKEAWTFFDSLNAQVPILNKDVPNRHDFLGRPITWANSAVSVINPFATSEVPTALEQELGDLNFTVRPMRKSLGNGLVQLQAEEYSQLTGLVGSVKISQHGNLEATLEELISGEDYKSWPPARRTMVIKRYIEGARAAALGTFLTNDEMSGRLKKAKQDNLASLLETPL